MPEIIKRTLLHIQSPQEQQQQQKQHRNDTITVGILRIIINNKVKHRGNRVGLTSQITNEKITATATTMIGFQFPMPQCMKRSGGDSLYSSSSSLGFHDGSPEGLSSSSGSTSTSTSPLSAAPQHHHRYLQSSTASHNHANHLPYNSSNHEREHNEVPNNSNSKHSGNNKKQQSTKSTPSSNGQQQQQQQAARSTLSVLDYYPNLGHDGMQLMWFHDAECYGTLKEALRAPQQFIVCGNVVMAQSGRFQVPIMYNQKFKVSDIRLENWLDEIIRADTVGHTRHAIKLELMSTRVVEPAFRILASMEDRFMGPVIIGAAILTENPKSRPPVDPWTFLMLCRNRMPRCTISIGWETANDGLSHSPAISPSIIMPISNLIGPLAVRPDTHLVEQSHSNGQHGLNQRQQKQQQQQQQSPVSSNGSNGAKSPASFNSDLITSDYHEDEDDDDVEDDIDAPLDLIINISGKTLARQRHRHAAINSNDSSVHNLSHHAHHHHHPYNNYGNSNNNNARVTSTSANLLIKMTNQHQQQISAMSLSSMANHMATNLSVNKHTKDAELNNKLSNQQQTHPQQQQQQQHPNQRQTNMAECQSLSRQMIDNMIGIVKEYNLTQPVTFPVRASVVKNSISELQRLLFQVGANSTITCYAEKDDNVNLDELLMIRRAFATNQVLYDLPEEVASKLRSLVH
ncbi:hypothetical protein GZH46_01810, partial [Fragariocoptes setiger]